MGLGERLRTTREEKGLTIEEVASTTFIRTHHLAALESEEYHLVPTSRITYFLKDYARVLGLDPDTLIAELPDDLSPAPAPLQPSPSQEEEEAPKKERPRPPREPRPKNHPKKEKKGLVFGGSEGVDEEGKSGSAKRRLGLRQKGPRYAPLDQGNPMLARIVIGIALLLILGLALWYIFSGDDERPAVALVSDTVEGSPTRIITRDGEEMDDDSDTSQTAVGAGDSLVLRGRFVARAWYSISIDGGTREEQGTRDSGAVMEWRALESFSVDLGNAGGVKFSLNGKDIGGLGPMGGTVNDRLINAEGLQGGPTTTSSAAGTNRRRRAPRRQPTTRREEERPAPPRLEPTAPRESLPEGE